MAFPRAADRGMGVAMELRGRPETSAVPVAFTDRRSKGSSMDRLSIQGLSLAVALTALVACGVQSLERSLAR